MTKEYVPRHIDCDGPFRAKIGPDGFAFLSPVLSALGDYWCVEAWVRDPEGYCGIKLLRERQHIEPDHKAVTEIFALVDGQETTVKRAIPYYIARDLGWC